VREVRIGKTRYVNGNGQRQVTSTRYFAIRMDGGFFDVVRSGLSVMDVWCFESGCGGTHIVVGYLRYISIMSDK